MTLEKGLSAFIDALLGKNRSSATIRAYTTDVRQFITFLKETNVAITGPADVTKVDVLEYFASLARKGLTGPPSRVHVISGHRANWPET